MIVTPLENRPVLEPCTLPELKYQVDPYIGCEHYCYYCYVLPQAETDWKKEVGIHADMVERLKSEISHLPPQTIYMGWHTDPYQPCEAEYRQTRQALKLLLENGFSASILTKSDLILRDIDLLQSMENAAVSVSVAFTDENIRGLFEARTKETAARISALQQLKAAGIKTAALICPAIPYITDVGRLIDLLVGAVDKIWIYGLSMLNRNVQNWRNIETILDRHFTDLKEPVKTAVFSKEHAHWQTLRQDLLRIQRESKLDLSIHV